MGLGILFFRSASGDDNDGCGQDPYDLACTQRGHTAWFVGPLTTREKNMDRLREMLHANDNVRSALAFTSKRAAGCFLKVLDTCDDAVKASWSRKPLYVVGKGTSRLLEARGLTTVGSDTGSADALADVIIEHRGSANGSLLFLRGDKTLDTLSQKLKEYDIGIEELVVYETAESPTFRHELECTVVNGNAPPPDWIVFFSPSGFDIVVPLVKDMGWWVDVKVASIGKTTARHITNHGGRVHAQAESPNPEKLLIAIESFGGSAL